MSLVCLNVEMNWIRSWSIYFDINIILLNCLNLESHLNLFGLFDFHLNLIFLIKILDNVRVMTITVLILND